MLVVYGSEQDKTNYVAQDKILKINSCGLNTSLSGGHRRGDTLSIRRPGGRKDYQLLYMAMGRAEHYLNGAWRKVEAGQAVLYLPNEPQFYLYQANTPVLCKWVHFSGAMAEELLEASGLRAAAPLMEVGDNREISQLYDRMIQETRMKPPGYETMAAALLQELISLMGRRLTILRDEGKYKARQKLTQVVEHMHYHYDEPQTIEQYAAQCGMSKYHFAHMFREYMGRSPYAYLTALRMERALELLSGSEMPVADVARACGYENPLYFSRVFSGRYGQPPTAYRRAALCSPASPPQAEPGLD